MFSGPITAVPSTDGRVVLWNLDVGAIGEQARIRCNELSDSLTTLREDHRKVNRTLDKLAADGVELPSDNNLASAWGGR